MSGLFQLRNASDLLAKLKHDYRRLEEAPDDAYIAFDFFVTAEHMLDWLYPGRANRTQRNSERNSNLILQVVSHLANGAKHMILEDPRHGSIQHADIAFTPYGEGAYGAGTFGGISLVVTLEGDAAAAFGHQTTPLKLANRALKYWSDHPELERRSG